MISGTVFNIQRFSLHDGPGVRTTVFMKGCSLHCRWCHNPEGLLPEISLQYDSRSCLMCGVCAEVCSRDVHSFSDGVHEVKFERCTMCGSCIESCPVQALQYSGQKYTPEELTAECLHDLAYYKKQGGITFSGGEPLLQAEFIAETSKMCKAKGIPTVFIDTAGYVPWESFETVLPYADGFLYDIKAFSDDIHIANTGQSNKVIIDNLKKLSKRGKDIFIRIPVIPSVNDSPQEMNNISHFLQKIKNICEVRLLPYHTVGQEKYKMLGMQPPENYGNVSSETMSALQQLFIENKRSETNGC